MGFYVNKLIMEMLKKEFTNIPNTFGLFSKTMKQENKLVFEGTIGEKR